ncbi:DUF4259 domain-containing protein [Corynebacterium uterequi]|uniref:Putative DUF4259 family protein n=1 Tax=Corynebacterium uterequi TaxID=1072256 RepID=A0A0G3HH67_9CORY|nr:DUF4259 domain-containing protein [Corynebacterium uterequi]AKK10522.1 putative DUF4259 family protein [Corynebacterium uterequi]
MSTWDSAIFAEDVNEDFLVELDELSDDEVVDAVRDACLLAGDDPTEEERLVGLAAATIAAIWAGAPFSAGDVAEEHRFITGLSGTVDEQLSAAAAAVLDQVADEHDVEQFLEALS